MNTNYFQGLEDTFGGMELLRTKDPLLIGRCRVRILGWHTENKSDLPTSNLPWAFPLSFNFCKSNWCRTVNRTSEGHGWWVLS